MGVAMASKISTALTDAYAKKWFSYLKGEKLKLYCLTYFLERFTDDSRMDSLFQKFLCCLQETSSKNHNTGCTILSFELQASTS
jgi:hypothetical protein